MTDAKKDEQDKEKPKGSALGIIALIFMIANLAGTGFIGFTLTTLAPASAEAKEEPVKEGPGPVVSMQPFVVKLDDDGSNRYLKTAISLELKNAEVEPDFAAGKHQIRDAFLRYLSGLHVEQTRGESGKTKIRNELLARAQKLCGEAVTKVYFGEFVVQ